MNVLLYAAKQTKSGQRLKRSLETVESLESLTDCWNLSELVTYFRTPDPLPETVVLQASTSQELKVFEAFRSRLEQVFFILVLPDCDEETIARGHQLRPRFIVYQDSDFSEVGAVIDRLHAQAQGGSPRGFLLPPA
jgi:DNA-binding NarL/FixJ family response regulator